MKGKLMDIFVRVTMQNNEIARKSTKECLESIIKACDRIMDNLKVNKNVVNSVDRFSKAMNPFDGLITRSNYDNKRTY